MNFKLHYITLVLFFLYLISCYFMFWDTKQIDWMFYPFIILPVLILVLIIVFGTNLTPKFKLIHRVTSTVFLISALVCGYSLIYFASGMGGIGMLFVGQLLLFVTFLMYVILWLIQKFNKLK